MKPIVVLDIDDSLVQALAGRNDAGGIVYYTLTEAKKRYGIMIEKFIEQGLLIRLSRAFYIVFPYVPALLRWLDQTGFIFCFWSAAAQKRNAPLVDILLQLSFTSERYQTLKSSIQILSQEDLQKISDLAPIATLKDLTVVVSKLNSPENFVLANCILADNLPDNLPDTQCKHGLAVPTQEYRSARNYANLFSKRQQSLNKEQPYRYVRANVILYIAGLLSSAKKIFDEGNICFSDSLYGLHMSQPSDEQGEITFYDKYIDLGVTALQRVHPGVTKIQPNALTTSPFLEQLIFFATHAHDFTQAEETRVRECIIADYVVSFPSSGKDPSAVRANLSL